MNKDIKIKTIKCDIDKVSINDVIAYVLDNTAGVHVGKVLKITDKGFEVSFPSSFSNKTYFVDKDSVIMNYKK